MKIYYIGNQTAGLVGRLTVLAQGYQIVDSPDDCDVLLCVHGRKILPRSIFEKPRIAAINVHPYLYMYKGADPIGRAIKDQNWKASVGCHHITETVDGGAVIKEMFVDVQPSNIRAEIYNQLYPYYSQIIIESLNILEEQHLNASGESDILVGGLGYP